MLHIYCLVEGKGIEPLTHACKAHVFPLAPTPHATTCYLAPRVGIEPTTKRLTVFCTTSVLPRN